MGILSIGVILVAAVALYLIFNPGSRPHSAEYAKTDIYVMKNAIDSSKAYMRASLDYSVYQALYDVSKKGGLSDSQSAQVFTNKLEPIISCAKTEKRLGETERIIGCVPGKLGCSSSDGKEAYINEGYDVGLFQFLLKNLGYNVAADCKFGKNSMENLKEFQKAKNLQESGFLDATTVNKLRESFAYDNCGDYFYGCSNSFSVFWSTAPKEDEVKNAVKKEIVKNINLYTAKGYTFIDVALVYLPAYSEDKSTFSQEDKVVKVSLSGDNIKVSKKDEYEAIYLESSSEMENIYGIDFFGMYRKAISIFSYVKGKGCDAIANEEKTEDGFKIMIKVIDKKTSPKCSAETKVSVTEENPKKYPVFNGLGVSFEPIVFEFLVKLV